jgi:tRNA uridine 5-carboxymethylaminomethyl modification enzyme
VEQLPCYLTYTTNRTADVIKANLHRSPMYSGQITGIGPRYCPSIEDKIVRFCDKDRHQIYLEPEGRITDEIYVNGASTSLPYEVQEEIIRSIVGLENAELLRPAYAVEYDFAQPTQLNPWLESKTVPNLFFAGQINGTSGYEEAAAQGIIAGINAALKAQGNPPFVLRRDEGYIGVMIDDLITKGAPEPYRMFTSRAEHRLLLRQDNAELRLAKYGFQFGLVDSYCWRKVCRIEREVSETLARLQATFTQGRSAADILKRPEVSSGDLEPLFADVDPRVRSQVEIVLKYDGYIDRELSAVKKLALLESSVIPAETDYHAIKGLRTEARQKLHKLRPYTLGHASRIPGVTPADIAVLSVWLRR